MARNNADWYRLLDLCGVTDTLIGDEDGLYHPAFFNDRLLLGLKGTMAEAELHILRARLNGGIKNKAARGELRRGLPFGLVWGDNDGEELLHPDQAQLDLDFDILADPGCIVPACADIEIEAIDLHRRREHSRRIGGVEREAHRCGLGGYSFLK